MKTLDLNNWKRKAHFDNFINFSDPFFNICADVDITPLLRYSHTSDYSFFILSYYLVLKSINQIEEFHYRIRDKQVVVHDTIHGSCTILSDDGIFGYGYFDFDEDFKKFNKKALKVIEQAKANPTFDPKFDRDDLIHSSVIPWISFKSFDHASRIGGVDSIPKVVMGRYYEINGAFKMPVSVAVHHALMDGLHVGKFFETYQQYLYNGFRNI